MRECLLARHELDALEESPAWLRQRRASSNFARLRLVPRLVGQTRRFLADGAGTRRSARADAEAVFELLRAPAAEIDGKREAPGSHRPARTAFETKGLTLNEEDSEGAEDDSSKEEDSEEDEEDSSEEEDERE